MADTETVKKQVVVADGNAAPDRVDTLALAAADEGFQDEVKRLVEVMTGALITAPGQIGEAVKHATTGYAAARLAREKMRGIINA